VSVTQYDQHQLRCGCGRLHTATRPDGARPGLVGYGPKLQALAVYLMVVHFLPAKRCVELFGVTDRRGAQRGIRARHARAPLGCWVRRTSGSAHP